MKTLTPWGVISECRLVLRKLARGADSASRAPIVAAFATVALVFSLPARTTAADAPPPTANQLKLLFSGPQDLTDTWGKLHFGVTPVRLVSIVGNTLIVTGLDAMDGTPVLDVKPYIPEFDSADRPTQADWVPDMLKGYF